MSLSIVPINQAEAICMPLFDGNLSNISEFTFHEDSEIKGSFRQIWDSCAVSSNSEIFTLEWNGEITTEEYNSLLISINFPEHIFLTCRATVNGNEKTLFENIKGAKAPVEPTSKALVKIGENLTITQLIFNFKCNGECIGKHNVNFYWVGLLNKEKENLIEEELPKYDVNSWDGLINFDGKADITENNLFFTKQEIVEMKCKKQDPSVIKMFEHLQNKVREWEDFVPENEIREYMPMIEHMYRFVRVRDRNRECLNGHIIRFAIAGYMFDNHKWSLMAARMIMCAVHTPKWFEGPQGCMKGSSWHHVCFTEDHHSGALAIALGFMGNIFTKKGIELIVNAVEKAWGVVDECCREPGYRWFMNQGMVSNNGRMIGAYFLYKYGRDYKKFIEESYLAHTTIVNHYFNDEGHSTEGPGYYQYTFNNAIPLWMIFARYKNVTIEEVLPEKFIRSINYVEACLSSNNNFGYSIALGTGHYEEFSLLILVFLAVVCKWDKAYYYIKNRLDSGFLQTSDIDGIDLLLLLKYIPEKIPEIAPTYKNLILFKNGGLLSYTYEKPFRGKVLFQCERNPLTGHHNEDRGGIVLEVNGKTMLLDLGSTNYSNPNSVFMRTKEYHNLAYPDNLPIKISNTVTSLPLNDKGVVDGYTTSEEFYPGPQFDSFFQNENILEFGADLKPLYGDEILFARRDCIFTENKDNINLIIEDKWQFQTERGLNISYLSYSPWEIFENSVTTKNDDMMMNIDFLESSGLDFRFLQDAEMIDCNWKKVYTLKIFIKQSKKFKVTSNIKVKKYLI